MSYRRVLAIVVFISLIAFAAMSLRRTEAHSITPDNSTIDVFADDNPQQQVVSGFDFSSIDRSVSACQDFNRFANGGWMDRNPVPAAYSRWGRFEVLDEQNIVVLQGILDALVKKKSPFLQPNLREPKLGRLAHPLCRRIT